jgi:hypothetical protein
MGSQQKDRDARLKAALRDNLKKRKARERDAADRGEPASDAAEES